MLWLSFVEMTDCKLAPPFLDALVEVSYSIHTVILDS
jgi:hypothetical protein